MVKKNGMKLEKIESYKKVNNGSIGAFPIDFVIVLIVISFLKDAKKYVQEMETGIADD